MRLRLVLADQDVYALPDEFKELLRTLARRWRQVCSALANCNTRIEVHDAGA